MTDTQVVIEAWWNASDGEYIDGVWTPNRRAQLAAALESLADQVISKVSPPCEDFDEYAQGFLAAHVKYRSEIHAIARELRGDTTTTQEEQ